MKDNKPQTWLLHSDKSICFCLQVEHKGRETNIVLSLTDLGVKLDGIEMSVPATSQDT